MNLKFSDLWRWGGEIPRRPFLTWAAVLFGVKYTCDCLLVWLVFGGAWPMYEYLAMPAPGMTGYKPAKIWQLVALLAMSLPFLWAGVALCLKRLRSAPLPLWLVVLFVVPMAKWFLFLTLALAPERDEKQTSKVAGWDWLPESVWGSAAVAVGVTAFFASGALALSATVLGIYGWGLFVGVPFAMGFFAAIIHGARRQRTLVESMTVGCASVCLAGAFFLVMGQEGAICMLMAAPLAFPLAIIGSAAGHAVQTTRWSHSSRQIFCLPILSVPLMLGAEKLQPGTPPVFKVVTAIEVEAPVETVWKHVIEFSELPPPTEWIFKAGIAYPERAEIYGRGVGAVRHCVFSTGPFVEPITVWDAPKLLRFSVTDNPEPLQEWTPYSEIHPRHLHGYLVSQQGQFCLTQLPGGRTLLEGTTWYRHGLWPTDYWKIWSDQIIHAIHRRVLMHVKQLAEKDVSLVPQSRH